MSKGPSAGVTDEERLAFYQERVAKAGLVGTALGGSALAFRVVGAVALGEDGGLGHPSVLYHLGGAGFLGLMWVLCRHGRHTHRFVEGVETVCIVASCAMYSVMGTYIPQVGNPALVVTLALTHGLFARAIYVPSSARRSLLLATFIGVPHIALVWHHWQELNPAMTLAFGTQYPGRAGASIATIQAVGAAMWWVLTIVGTGAASHVIYGLRQEVRDVRRLGQYELGEQLGQGGMGVVYRARHGLLQRPTAVKLLPPGRVGEQTLSRFEREVRLTASLTHPNTVTVYDYGRTLDGIFYYAMELLDDGATLDEVVRAAGPLSPSRVVRVLADVSGALAEAHEAGLIHRDIKPQNLMLCRRGGRHDTVKVLDFGLVKELEDPGAASLTGMNVIVGTPHFMAPEMLTRPDEVDARSDLYGLGAVAFFLLTNEMVFDGKTVVEVCGHHLHTPPRSVGEVAAQAVPPALTQLVAACLAKAPTDRPASAKALRASLLAVDLAPWTDDDAATWWAEHGDAVRLARTRAASATERSILRPAPRGHEPR